MKEKKISKLFSVIQGGGVIMVVLFWILMILGVIGWCMNIKKLVKDTDFQAPYKAEVCRVVGIVPPVGAVMGWINFDEGTNVVNSTKE